MNKDHKKALNSLQRLTNKVRADHSFGKIHTLKDYFISLGYDEKYIRSTLHYYDSELSQPIDWKEIKSRLDDLRIALETSQWLENNPPIIEHEEATNIRTGETEVLRLSNTLSTVVSPMLAEESEYNEKDYGLTPANKEVATLYWFQKKYAKQMLNNLKI